MRRHPPPAGASHLEPHPAVGEPGDLVDRTLSRRLRFHDELRIGAIDTGDVVDSLALEAQLSQAALLIGHAEHRSTHSDGHEVDDRLIEL